MAVQMPRVTRRRVRRTRRLLALAIAAASLTTASLVRAPDAALAASDPIIALQPVVSGLDHPVLVTNAGDARLFVVEQTGRIRIVSDGTLLATPFLDLSSQISSGGERGLLGLAFHPGYATNGRFFVYYTRSDGDIQVSEFARSAGDANRAAAGSERPILRIEHSTYSNHNGGMLAFGPDGYLYIGTGDGGGGGDPLGSGQNIDSRLGKLLRLDVDTASPSIAYDVPPTNPFVGTAGDDLVWSYGLRNPWRFSFDRANGDLWIGDVGQGAWEEVDVARSAAGGGRGLNFGWNVLEGDHCYNATTCVRTGKTAPIAEYPHGTGDCAITGGFVYRGSVSPLLIGRYLFGDYCSGRIWSLVASGPSPQAEVLLTDTSLQISSFGEDAAGEVYVVALGGTIYHIIESHVVRRSGPDRYATAAAISAAVFHPGVPVVYVATGQNYPDAVAGGPAAADEGGPVLLVRSDAIPSATAAELNRLKPGHIVVLGGTAAVSAGVASALAGYTAGPVVRRSGSDRYATAAAISAAVFHPGVPVVYVATGQNYPDAVAGGPAAADEGGPVLLVRSDAIPSATAAELNRLKPGHIVVLGGTSAVSAGVASALAGYTAGPVVRRSGPDRYATAAAISAAVFHPGVPVVYVATGQNYPDAVAGGPAAADEGGPVLLVRSDAIPSATAAELNRLKPGHIVVLGGTSAVSAGVASALAGYTTGT